MKIPGISVVVVVEYPPTGFSPIIIERKRKERRIDK
jgi:hypothetical protein